MKQLISAASDPRPRSDRRSRRGALLLVTFLALASVSRGQLSNFPTGANRAEVSWHTIETDHFTIVYHDGLEGDAREAAVIAESVYPVVTTNLGTEIPGRTLLYLSDLDDIANAIAVGDWYIHIWMRGILADNPFGGVRSAGRAKWLRTVITHEFTHTVIARGTRGWLNTFSPFVPTVPRWFNEGTARFMEPDGWTTDLDMVLRVAAVNARLGYGGLLPGRLDGTLLYETGHSLVRYMTVRFGDTVLARILDGGHSVLGYNFDAAVTAATGTSMSEIYDDWLRTVTVLYGATYAERKELEETNPAITTAFEYVAGIRYSPDRSRIALLAGRRGEPVRLYLMTNDSTRRLRELSDETGFDGRFSWSPDGRRLVLAKQRKGAYRALLQDLYLLDVESGGLTRLTDDAGLSDPDWSPRVVERNPDWSSEGGEIVAVQRRAGRDNLVTVDPETGFVQRRTSFTGDIQFYTPEWSPDGRTVAVSMFEPDGRRTIALFSDDWPATDAFVRLTSDSANNRYPTWSPDGTRIAFTSHIGGIPNIHVMNADGSGSRRVVNGSDRYQVTDVAGGVYTAQWLPGRDSLVVIGIDTRDRIAPHVISASTRVTPASPRPVPEKYQAWRDVRPALTVPERSEMPIPAISEPESYASLAHVRPVVPVVPFFTGDPAVEGRGKSIRPALGGAWFDPMGKHIFGAYVDYGLSTRNVGAEFLYTNNTLPVMIEVIGKYHPASRRLHGLSYDEQQTGLNLRGVYLLPAPNSLDINHEFMAGLKYRSLKALNRTAFETLGLEQELIPGDADLVEMSASYRYTSSTFLFMGRYTHADETLGGSLGYDKVNWQIVSRYPLFGSKLLSVLTNVEGGLHWGPQVAQEFMGLDRFGMVENGIGLDDFVSPEPLYRVRGIKRYVFGDRVATGAVGLTGRLPILESYFPLMRLVPTELHLFAEAGAAWYARRTALADVPIVAGYGLELRARYLTNLWIALGIAFEMTTNPRRDIYLQTGYSL